MSRPLAPPPTLRATLDGPERQLIQAVVGPADDDLLRPLRDARGREFQRLEFLGDSVLDLVLAVHACAEPTCPSCRRVDGHVTRLVTDVQLGRRARSRGLGDWLEWQASDERLADLVEACVAVAFVAGSWARACACTASLVHPLGPATTRTLEQGWVGPDTPTPVRATGSALLELAAGQTVFVQHPDADEGELSRRRAELHQASRVAHRARRRHLVDEHGADAGVSDRVEVLLADRLLSAGADAALQDAVSVLVDE